MVRAMGKRYLRTFRCTDCDTPVTKMWEGGRPLVCVECAKTRVHVATDGARAAVAAYERECRLRIRAARLAVLEGPEGAASVAQGDPTGVSRTGSRAS
jgi:hypothetical protein